MPERYCQKGAFVEDTSLCFAKIGLPRMAGRVLGVLLVSNPPEQSLSDLCEVLQVSKSALSTNTRLLTSMGLIEQVPSSKPREVAFRSKAGGWVAFMRLRLRLMTSLHRIAERGLELLKDESPALCERLQEAHHVFSQVEEELSALLSRIEHEQGAK